MKPVDPRALPLLRPAASSLAGVVLAGAIGGGLVVAQAFAVGHLLTALLAAPAGNVWHGPAWWLVGITAARALVGAASDLAAARAAGQVSTALRGQVLQAAFQIGRAGLSRRRTGGLGLLATRGVAAVEPYLTRFVPTLALAAVLPPLTLVAIFWLDPWAGVIVLCTLPLVPVFAVLIGLATRDRAGRQYRTLEVLAGHFWDVVRGLPTLVTFNRADRQSGQIRRVTGQYRRATMATLRTAFASSAALELIATLSVALVAVWVGLRLAAGELDFDTALIVLLLAPEAYWPLRRVGAEFHAAAEGASTLSAITDLLEEARPEQPTRGATRTNSMRHEGQFDVDPVSIEVEGLVVRYDGASVPALVLPRARIPATGLTVVVGASGCGKSTFVQALLGELTPERGRISLAGAPLDLADWRARVAQVPQTPWLTAGTVAENLRIGWPGATGEQLWAALASVELGEAIAALPLRLDTPLGEDGAGLSAGQRARLALARVVLADRPYVFLDEPTAHLDAETERIMLDTLRRLTTHATVVVVAHRDAMVAAADQVIRLEPPDATDPSRGLMPTASETRPASPATEAPAPAGDPPTAPERLRHRMALAALLATLASLSGVALTATAGWLIARAAEHPPVLMLMVAIVGVRAFGLARPALRYAERLVGHDVALRLLAERRARVYDVLVPLVPARLGRRRGDLLASVVDDVDAELDDQLRVRLPVLTWLGVSVAASAIVALIHVPLALPVLVLSFGGGAAALLVAHRGSRRAERSFVTERADLSAELIGDLQDARQLVLWQADGAAVDRLGRRGGRLASGTLASAAALTAARASVLLLAAAAVLSAARLLAPAVDAGVVSGPMAALVLLVPLALTDVLLPLAEAGAVAARTRAARDRLAALTTLQPAVTEPALPRTLDLSGPLKLDGVVAGWDQEPVLQGLDLTLGAGDTVGVVGPSGSGKSTLAALLVRHLQPNAGHHLLAGVDTAMLGSAEVRRHVGLVGDDPYIFGSSVRENLRLAAPAAADDELAAALHQSGLARWFDDLPYGLDTMIGDGAAEVSGGERARLGIARALLANPEVLVLDEPTAHLDAATAESVSATLLEAREGRSVVWITHDGVALGRLDAVLTVAGGRVVPEAAATRSHRSSPH